MFKALKNNKGQSMTEYILIVALIAVVCIVVVKKFGSQIASLFESSTQKIGEAKPK